MHADLELAVLEGRHGQRRRAVPPGTEAVEHDREVAAPEFGTDPARDVDHLREHLLDDRHVVCADVRAQLAAGLAPRHELLHERLEARARAKLEPLVGDLVIRAQASGELRDDLRADDVPIIQKMLAEVIEISAGVSPELWRRYLTIVLDGLRTRRDAPTALPVPALDHSELASCMRALAPARASRPTRE